MITKPYTIAEIRSKFESGDYSAELMLQHLMIRYEELEEQVLDATEDAIREQALYYEQDETFDSMAITSIMEKMELLEQHGRFEILKQHGRRVIGKFIEQPKEAT